MIADRQMPIIVGILIRIILRATLDLAHGSLSRKAHQNMPPTAKVICNRKILRIGVDHGKRKNTGCHPPQHHH